MKRLFVLLLAAIFLAGSAAADPVDLSGMSFDDLVALRDHLNLAIWNSREWQEVQVPAGIWEIGVDIPAGHWQINPKEGGMAEVFYCEGVDRTARLPDFDKIWYKETIISTSNSNADRSVNYVDYDLVAGWFIINRSAVFITPYTGKPDLGFR